MSDANGSLVPGSLTRYLPFGEYRGAAPTQTLTDRDFTGQKENRELGLLYYNARYYVSGIGRFASADTILPDPANPQSFNRYSYVRNNPLSFIDPTGHCDQITFVNGNEETLARDARDNECWKQYDERFETLVERRGRTNFDGLSEEEIIAAILQELGDGSDWEYQKSPSMCGDGNGNYPCKQQDIYRPCQHWEDCNDPVGEYGAIGGNFFIGGRLIMDDWGNIYLNIHVSTSPGLGVTSGNIQIQEKGEWKNIEDLAVDQQEPTVQEYLTGWGVSSCVSLGVTACGASNPANNKAQEVGFSTPGIGGEIGYTWLILDNYPR